MTKDRFDGWLSEMLKTDDKEEKEEQIQRMFIILMGWTADQVTEWLNTPNDELNNRSPQEVMDEGNSGINIVHDLMIDMIVGNPT
jgi:uncharacterized protein (DUF2384 family)